MRRWTYLTILGRSNKRTTIITMYRPCNVRIEDVGGSTVAKKQWLIMQNKNRNEHPHKSVIKDIIKKRKNSFKIITKS